MDDGGDSPIGKLEHFSKCPDVDTPVSLNQVTHGLDEFQCPLAHPTRPASAVWGFSLPHHTLDDAVDGVDQEGLVPMGSHDELVDLLGDLACLGEVLHEVVGGHHGFIGTGEQG